MHLSEANQQHISQTKNYFPSSKSRIHSHKTFLEKKPALIHKEWDFCHFNACSSYPENVEESIQERW
jgi:hypothetical protein